jgi:RNA 3'-terminal phosphate cyclase (ATP)
MIDHIHIDGSQGEGGGQIVRSSLALAVVTGRAVTIERIRAGREKPGLMRQHLTAVNAVAEICGGDVSGAAIGSRAITFEPRGVRPGTYCFRVGTAGSATLVLQTVLPALLTAGGPSSLVLEGGTHNPWSPPFDFLQRAYLPLVNRMGPRVTATLERHGFFPAGGGRFIVEVEPSAKLAGFDLCERGEIRSRRGRVLLANLPSHIAQRERDTIARKLNWDPSCLQIEEVEAGGPGNAVLIEIESEHVTEVFTGFGRHGIRSEHVAGSAVEETRDYLAAGVPVGPHLADQLLLPLGLSAWQGGNDGRAAGGSFRTLRLTRHSQTHIDILRTFLGVTIGAEQAEDGASCVVNVGPPE